MTGFLESFKNNSKTQKYIEIILDKYSNESYKTQSQTGQNAFLQTIIYAEAVEIMCETIENMYKQICLRDNKFKFLAVKFKF